MSDAPATTEPRAKLPGRNLYVDGPPALTARHKLLIEYMVVGCQNPIILRRLTRPAIIDPDTGETVKPARSPEVGQQLSLVEAAELVGLRHRTARTLAQSKIFQKAMAAAVTELRNGAKAHAMQKVIDQLETTPHKAADRKVILEAADRILGDQLGTPNAAAVQVNILNQQSTITPGYIIKTRAPEPTQQPKTIDITPTHTTEGSDDE